MGWLERLVRDSDPLELLPGLRLVVRTEVAGPPDMLFTVDVLRLVCTWFQ